MQTLRATIAAVLFCLIPHVASAADAKTDDVDRLLVLMGVGSLPTTMSEIMTRDILAKERQINGPIPPAAEQIIRTTIAELSHQQAPRFFSEMRPLITRYYSRDDIKQLIVFLDSPLGRRYTASNQAMMGDMTKIGQTWGVDFGKLAAAEVTARLRKAGYE